MLTCIWWCLFEEFIDDVDDDSDDDAVRPLYVVIGCLALTAMLINDDGEVVFAIAVAGVLLPLLQMFICFNWLQVGHLSTLVTGCIWMFDKGAEDAIFVGFVEFVVAIFVGFELMWEVEDELPKIQIIILLNL